ncbi:MAG: hypothetical protein KIT83_01380 [Bryobacterales bacterium]|nr:hypothetical protein [Bryobacterales bacterium]
MTTDWMEIEFLANRPNGVARVLCRRGLPLAEHTHGSGQVIPDLLCGIPLLLDVRLQAAPESPYLLWACWSSPDMILQPGFVPLNEWRMSLSPRRRTLPVLMLARAQGRYDLPPVWDPEFAALLDERNPTGTMDGRLLLLACPDGPPSWCPAEELARALSLYVASLSPGVKQPLPAGCFLVRSGYGALSLETVPQVRVFAAQVFAKTTGIPRTLSRKPFPLPPGLALECQLRGNLLWGAWRGDAPHHSDLTCFVSTTSRADRATSLRFRVNCSMSASHQNAFTDALLTTAILERRARVSPTAGEASEASKALITLITRRLLQSVETDGRLARVIKTPYFVVRQEARSATLSIHEAAVLPQPWELPDGGQGPSEPADQRQQTDDFVSLFRLLSQDRDLQVLLPDNPWLARNPHARGGRKAVRRAGGNAPPDSDAARSLRRGAMAADLCTILSRIRSVTREEPTEDLSPLTVSLQWTRPRPLLMALLPEVLELTKSACRSLSHLTEALDSADCVQCDLTAELHGEAFAGWIRPGSSVASRETGVRSVALAVQSTLRSLLAISVCTTLDAGADSVWTRALLVHRYARALPLSDKSACVEDPRSDSVVVRTAHSALPAIQKAAKLWQQLLRRAGMAGTSQTAANVAQYLVAKTIANPFQLRKILLEEQEMCERVVHFFDSLQVNHPYRGKPGKASPQDQRTASLLLRAAKRIYPGGAARELVPLLLLAAAGAIAGKRGVPSLNYRLELRAASMGSTNAA